MVCSGKSNEKSMVIKEHVVVGTANNVLWEEKSKHILVIDSNIKRELKGI